MPADADLLCEYYISSNLNSHKKPKFNTNLTKLKSISDTSLSNTTASNFIFNESATTIDFVKYDKNPMDYLKQKYQLLGDNNSNKLKQSLSLNSLSNGTSNGSTVNGTNIQHTKDKWVELSWSKIRKSGIGLLNLGNNCYLNATLQCLAYTPPLSQWLITRPHSPSCKFKQVKGFCSLCEVERIIYDIFNSANGFAKPNSLCYNIKKISAVFGVGTQEDASEFFTTLLESMAKSIKFALNIQNKLLNGHVGQAKKVNTILDDIFSFQFRSRITCCNCGRTSDTIENTNTWPVDVKYVQDIRKGMLHFLREEVLDGENAYKCEKCSKKTRATKKYSIRTAPNILVIHLKRFDFSYAGKLSHYVTYPETLSLKTFIPETSNCSSSHSPASHAAISSLSNSESNLNSNEKSLRNTNYKLYGVLVHLGYTSHSGHYYSYVRGPNEIWYKADDQRVNAVQTKDALSQNAYILFYSKITEPILETKQNLPAPPTPITTPLKNNIPKVITEQKSEPKTEQTSNYLNSLNSKPQIYGPTLPNKLVKNEKIKKVKKDYEKMTRKGLKKIIRNIKSKIKIEAENTKLKRKLKKLKKILKIKKQKFIEMKKTPEKVDETSHKKRKIDEDGTDSSLSVSSLSSLSSTSSKKSFKKLKSEPNGLTLLKQYKSSSSSSSSLSASPSPSPEPRPEPAQKQPVVYSYNSSSKLPTSNQEEKTDEKIDEKKNSDVFSQIKNSSFSNVKSWSGNSSNVLKIDEKKDEKSEYDEYNEEFDKPFIRESKLKHNSKKYQSPYSGFHVYTHSSNGDQNNNKTHNNWNRFPHQKNGFNNHQNFNRSKTFNVFHKR
ncbi:unnamed protein product [Brachionus calyciflorus]|uniref:Ubiquitin carboxyl-terminal hydrolase n=1 Tax=Brachionus calyciflorus TaxID=104777 RepID=A0A813VAC4_9BILA|nr:unnamed protein product [Brachionus calyciflorus]